MKYPKMFEPGNIGSVHLKNRIVMSPLATLYSRGPNSQITDRYIEFYRERARGGAGLIITNHIKAERTIDPYPLTFGFSTLDSASELKYFLALTEAVHPYGAKMAIELSAGTGRLADAALKDKWPVGPSELPLLFIPNITMRALTKEEITGLVESYGTAAGLAKQAGFDIIYVHVLAYLLDQFLTPCWNQRTDEYGGSLDNRMRFMLECIASARRQVGEDFPLIVGLAIDHGIPGGRRPEEAIQIARKLKEINIDALHLRRGSYDNLNLLIPADYMPDGVSVALAERIKREVGLPVIVDGNLSNPDLAERLLEENRLDFVGEARALFADPRWPEKAKAGKNEEILPCIRCNQCINRVFFANYAACAVNPRTGLEYLGPLLPASKRKKILVAGGGPAGMTAARVAAERGHDVVLVEQGAKLGGHLLEATAPAHKKELRAYYEWAIREMQNSPVQVRLNTRVTKELVKQQLKPDAIIVATGSVPRMANVPGLDKPNVQIATQLLAQRGSAGQQTVIVGGGLVGCETALYLADQGKKVTVVEMLPEIAADVIPLSRSALMVALKEKNIALEPGLKLKEIADQGIIVEDAAGKAKTIPADTVIMATGLESDNSLYDELLDEAQEIYQIGDCVEPRSIIDANREAYYIARDI